MRSPGGAVLRRATAFFLDDVHLIAARTTQEELFVLFNVLMDAGATAGLHLGGAPGGAGPASRPGSALASRAGS